MLANSLLYYCYLPVVLGSLVCISQKPMISINTAQYVLIQAFMNIKYQPLVNTVVAALLLNKLPSVIKKAIEHYPEIQPMSYRYKWMIKLANHYTAVQYVTQHYNELCFESFLEDQKYICLKPIQEKISEIEPELRYDNETRQEFNRSLYIIIKECLSQ